MTENEKRLNTAGYYLLFISLGFGLGITGPVLPSLAKQTGSTLGTIGAIFFASALGAIMGTAVSGRILDRISRGHLLLGIAQLLNVILFTVTPLAGSLPLLLLIFFIGGFPSGIVNAGSNTLIMWTHGKKAGPYINGLHFTFGLGAFLAPTIFAKVLEMGGTYQYAYWALAGLALPIGLFMIFLPGSPQHPDKRGDSDPSPINLQKLWPTILVAMLFLFFYVGSEITFGNWIFTYATTLDLASVTSGAYLTSGFWLAFTIGRAISIPVAAAFKPAQILSVAFIGGLGSLAVIILTPQSSTMLWAATLATGFFMAPIWATGYNLAGQSMKLTATISSIIILGDSFGAVVLPSATGKAIEQWGAESMPKLVFTSLALTAFVFSIMLFQRREAVKEQVVY